MNAKEELILQELYEKRDRKPLALGDLEVQTGMDVRNLRNVLESLKDRGWVLEELDKYFITNAGVEEARSRWA